jgi:hypothetical protein
MASGHRCSRGTEGARPGPGLMRAERVNPAMGPWRWRGYAWRCGRPTVRGAEFPWRDRVLIKRMPAAEKQREDRGRRAGYSPGGPLGNRPDSGLVPVSERALT